MRLNFGATAARRRSDNPSMHGSMCMKTDDFRMRVAAITLIISLTATPCIGMEISQIAGCEGATF
jgi:hypothetical protein